MTLELRINSPCDHICTVHLPAEATLHELQASIEANAQIPRASQVLFHGLHRLSHTGTLGDALPIEGGCAREEELLLVRKSREQIEWLQRVEEQPGNSVVEWLRQAPADVQRDKDVVLVAVAKDAGAFQCASAELREDSDVMWAAVTKCFKELKSASPALRDKSDLFVALATSCRWSQNHHIISVFGCAPRDLRHNRDNALAAVAADGKGLAHVLRQFKGDRDVVLAAVAENGLALEYASQELRADRDVVRVAMARNEQALRFASEELQAELGACDREGENVKRARHEL